MSILKIKCKCGRELKIDVKTIDILRAENNRLKKERDDLKARLAAREMMDNNSSLNAFNDIFK